MFDKITLTFKTIGVTILVVATVLGALGILQ